MHLTNCELDELTIKGKYIQDQLGLFIGCRIDEFASTSTDLFLLARKNGLVKSDKVLEVGCGCLRTGKWFVEFLQDGGYCGIEPNQEMLNAGIEVLLGRECTRSARFSHNDLFDFSVFEERFSWVVGYSIWTHAARSHIESMLDQIANMRAKFLFSFAPTHPKRQQYVDEGWIGKSHLSKEAGIAYHAPELLIDLATKRGLHAYILPSLTSSQLWLYGGP